MIFNDFGGHTAKGVTVLKYVSLAFLFCPQVLHAAAYSRHGRLKHFAEADHLAMAQAYWA